LHQINYQCLPPQEKGLYHKYISAFQNNSRTVDFPPNEKLRRLMKVLGAALGDHPEIIYFDKGYMKTRAYPTHLQLQFTGCPQPSRLQAMQRQLEYAAEKAIGEIGPKKNWDEYQKLMAVYNYLQHRVNYDHRESQYCALHKESRNQWSHNAYGALVKGTAVCDGISAAFAMLSQRLDIPAASVVGKALLEDQGYTDHAWNLVRVGQEMYHLDLTWDINRYSSLGRYSYDYFCVPDADKERDHQWDRKAFPPCLSSALSFYSRNQYYGETAEDIQRIISSQILQGRRVVYLKLSPAIKGTEEAERLLSQLLLDTAGKMGKSVKILYTWNPPVRCFASAVTYL